RYRRDTIGFVFQASNLVPFLSVRENLLLVSNIGAPVRGSSARARAEEILEELGLGERMDALASDLSGGERQRAAIGRALMHDPPVLLVDEPTSNLDSSRGRRVVELLAHEVRSRGKLGVMVTHDLAMAELADRVITLRDGRVVAGSVELS